MNGRTDFSDFSFGKERVSSFGKIFSEQLQDIIKPINETISVNCWHLWTKKGRKEPLWLQVELAAIQFFSWSFFQPTKLEKKT